MAPTPDHPRRAARQLLEMRITQSSHLPRLGPSHDVLPLSSEEMIATSGRTWRAHSPQWIVLSVAAGHSILKRKLRFQRKRLPVHLSVGVDKVIQRLPSLRRVQPDVPTHGKLHAIVIMRSEKIIPLLRMLPRLGSIHRNPSISRQIKLGPA